MRQKLPRPVADRICSRVIVTLKTGESFSGVLFEADGGALVLRDCSAIGVGENRTDLMVDGELLLLLPDVAYIQRP